jgi:hypothetical protein
MLHKPDSRSTCANCRFWDNPPGFDSRTGLAVWPFTADRDWCGGYKADPDFEDGLDD